MTNVITYSNFTGTINLDLNAGEQAQITLYITQLQEEILKKLFGVNLYSTLDVDPVPKWTELITPGTTYYEYAGYKYKYPGLSSMLANYVYFHWNNQEWSSSTTRGETVPTDKDSIIVYNQNKQCLAWNKFVDLYYEVVTYILYKNSIEVDYFEDFEYEEMEKINLFGI